MVEPTSSGVTKTDAGRSGKWVLAIIFLVALVAFGFEYAARRQTQRIAVRICLQTAEGLAPEAPVSMSGTRIGFVTAIRAQPQLKTCPVEVSAILNTAETTSIPQDSEVTLDHANSMNETQVNINPEKGTGQPLENGGVLYGRQ